MDRFRLYLTISVAVVLLLSILNCTMQPNVPNVPTVSPSVMQNTPVPSQTLMAPGTSTITSNFTWDLQGAPSNNLKGILAGFTDVVSIQQFLINFNWDSDYDTTKFLSPDELLINKKGVCTAFARFYLLALEKQGYACSFLTIQGSSSAHAIVLFMDNDGHYRCSSNQFYYAKSDFGIFKGPAIIKAAEEFFQADWRAILVYDDSGVIREKITNTNASFTPNNPEAGFNVFEIKR